MWGVGRLMTADATYTAKQVTHWEPKTAIREDRCWNMVECVNYSNDTSLEIHGTVPLASAEHAEVGTSCKR